jgi:hypothetical protein
LNVLNKTAVILLVLTGIINAANADTALHSITGYTSSADGSIRKFEALVIDDEGRVVAVGDQEMLEDYADAKMLDGDGRFVLPGLIDAHAHVSSQGFLNVELNLAGTPNLDDAVAQIAAYAKANPGSGWIEGRGWNQVLWPVREFPGAADIDAVVADRPVWLRRIDGHAGWANSKAMELAGIDNETPDPVGGSHAQDHLYGGVVVEAAVAA